MAFKFHAEVTLYNVNAYELDVGRFELCTCQLIKIAQIFMILENEFFSFDKAIANLATSHERYPWTSSDQVF